MLEEVKILFANIFNIIRFYISSFCYRLKKLIKPSSNPMPPYLRSGRVVTLNDMGWMHPIIDSFTQSFLDQCKSEDQPVVLEIGAAYGYASVEALKLGAETWVNDLDKRHLDIFYQRLPKKLRTKVKLVPGDFPEGLNLPKEHFDAILAVRVLHYFTPQKLEEAAKSAYSLLKPNGKIYVVAASPYLKFWSFLIPDYEMRKKNGDLYPGFIDDVTKYTNRPLKFTQKEIHFLDPDVLTRVFTQAGFIVTKCEFYDRPDYPNYMRLDGRETVGMIAQKPK
jgi:SAM-dependent methyltransferase